MRNRPFPRFTGDMANWARAVEDYLTQGDTLDRQRVEPVTPLLAHQVGARAHKATEDGILMYDPLTQQPVYSKGGKWNSFQTVTALSYQADDLGGGHVADINGTDYTGQEGAIGMCAQVPVGTDVSFYHKGTQYVYSGPRPVSIGAGCADTLLPEHLIPTGVGTFLALTDTPGSYDAVGDVAVVNGALTGLEWQTPGDFFLIDDPVSDGHDYGRRDAAWQRSGVEAHNAAATYQFDDLVGFEGTIYHCIGNNVTGPFDIADWSPIASATGSGITLTYRWDTSLAGDPGSGRFAITDPIANPTNTLRISKTTDAGNPVDDIWLGVNEGERILFVEDTGGAEAGFWIATGPAVDQGTWVDVPVNWIANIGEPENNRKGFVSIIFNPLRLLPPNGSHYQSLVKNSDDNYDVLWDWRPTWWNTWVDGTTYPPQSMVLDDAYLMISNTETTDRPAPQAIGDPTFIYDGTSPTGQLIAKSLTVGNEYTLPVPLFLTRYRVYTVTGNEYSVFLVVDDVVTELIAFTATAIGWQIFTLSGNLVPANATFSLAVRVVEPDPTPSTFTLSYNYFTPNNVAVPVAGQIVHANQAQSEFRVHKTDQNGDQSGQLAGIVVGDIIEGAGVRWSIQAVTDNGTWINYAVAPASQGSPDGVQDFIFETVSATPITTVIDTDFYLTDPNVAPFFVIDGGAVTPSDNGFGVDLEYQEASISPDWDLMSTLGSSGEGDSGGGGGVPEAPQDGVQYGRQDATWTPVIAGVTDHGDLTGLGIDDHPQYHNDTRGDARYVPITGGNFTGAISSDGTITAGGRVDAYSTFYRRSDATAATGLLRITTEDGAVNRGQLAAVPASATSTSLTSWQFQNTITDVQFAQPVDMASSLDVSGTATVNGNLVLDRASGSTAYLDVKGDAGQSHIIRFMDAGGTVRNAITRNSAGRLELGNSNFSARALQSAWHINGNFYSGFGVTGGVSDPASSNVEGLTLNSSGPYASFSQDANTCLRLRRGNNNGTIQSFRRSATTVGSISVNNSSTTYNTTSDPALKQSIKKAYTPAVPDPIDPLLNVLGTTVYDFKFNEDVKTMGDDAPTVRGFMAPEVYETIPQAATPAHTDTDGTEYPWMLDHSQMVPDLWVAVQALITKVNELEEAANE